VLENRQIIEPSVDQRRPRKRKRSDDEMPAAPPSAPAAPAVAIARPERAVTPPKPRLAVPAKIEGDTPDAQIGFLAHWHPILRDHIIERTADPGRREMLIALAQRLDPAAWTDADEITVGLQHATEALERLSRVFARRRRRPRRAPRASSGAGTVDAAPGPDEGDSPDENAADAAND
jgi:hypothetical protein